MKSIQIPMILLRAFFVLSILWVDSAVAEPVVGFAITSEGLAMEVISNAVPGSGLARTGKIAAGSVVRTSAHRTVMLQLMPGYVLGVDENTELVVSNLDQSPLGSSTARRTIFVELRKGRIAGFLERYYPERTHFQSTTVNGYLGNQSQGIFVLSTDARCTRDLQVQGNAAWTYVQKPGHPVTELRTRQVLHICPDKGVWLCAPETDPDAPGDRAFGIGMLRLGIQLGILDGNAFPDFAKDLDDLHGGVRDRLLNPANFGGRALNPSNAPHIDTTKPPPPLGADPPVDVPPTMSPQAVPPQSPNP